MPEVASPSWLGSRVGICCCICLGFYGLTRAFRPPTATTYLNCSIMDSLSPQQECTRLTSPLQDSTSLPRGKPGPEWGFRGVCGRTVLSLTSPSIPTIARAPHRSSGPWAVGDSSNPSGRKGTTAREQGSRHLCLHGGSQDRLLQTVCLRGGGGGRCRRDTSGRGRGPRPVRRHVLGDGAPPAWPSPPRRTPGSK